MKRVLERAANRATAGSEIPRRTRNWVDDTTGLRLRDERTSNGEVHPHVSCMPAVPSLAAVLLMPGGLDLQNAWGA